MSKLLKYAMCLMLLACGVESSSLPLSSARSSINASPITEMSAPYLNQFQGGLYPDGTNIAPAIHDSLGKLSGNSVTGLRAFISIGYSNPAQEWCSKVTMTSYPACNSWSFIGKANADPAVIKAPPMKLADGAIGTQTNLFWDDPSDTAYGLVKSRLASKGIPEDKVQVIWFKIAHTAPNVSLPNVNADAYKLVVSTGNAIRAMAVRYPNLKQIYISPRIYAGYSITVLNPEPYAYESGFAVKWVIAAQIRQYETGIIDSLAGDLGPTMAPFVTWGPYLWANGVIPRADGLSWLLSDFEGDGTHPNTAGETKAATRMISFFKSNPYSSCWFKVGGVC